MTVEPLPLDWPADRILVVGESNGLRHLLASRYHRYRVCPADNALAALALAESAPVRAVVLTIDPASRRLTSIVQALREVCGPEARLVLCCEPACEALARRVLESGADDYVIEPPTGEELDVALGIPPPAGLSAPAPDHAALSMLELDAVNELLSEVSEGTAPLLRAAARWLQSSLRAARVRVVADQITGEAGAAAGQAALFESLTRGGEVVGQIELWPPQAGPFVAADAEKLRHFSRLLERMLSMADHQARWRRIALTDDLTGLPNRRYLEGFLDRLLARAISDRMRVTFLFFDIDNFKHYNDRYGHAVGDQIIREAGKLFQQCCRQHDVVARYGGDEFGVVFWDAEEPRVAGSQHPDNVWNVLERFRAALKRHTFPSLGAHAKGSLTISGGLAGFPWDARTREELIGKADQALLAAKTQGKNRIFLVGQ